MMPRSLFLLVCLSIPWRLGAQEWTVYGGNAASTRFSPLKQINSANVGRLAVNWALQTGVPGKYETTPLFENGILYFTGPSGHAWGIDARTGRTLWHFARPIPKKMGICCGPVNRGFALAGNRLFLVTVDAHVIALDKRTGQLLWDTIMDDYKKGYSATGAPLLVKDKIVVGMAGGDYANRGFLDAYSLSTGERMWRIWTTPGPGEPGSETWQDKKNLWQSGGGSTWVTGSYDPQLNLVYWGTGNPGPDLIGDVRPGDNLYTNSMLAVDADSGKLKWHFQFTPHDTTTGMRSASRFWRTSRSAALHANFCCKLIVTASSMRSIALRASSSTVSRSSIRPGLKASTPPAGRSWCPAWIPRRKGKLFVRVCPAARTGITRLTIPTRA